MAHVQSAIKSIAPFTFLTHFPLPSLRPMTPLFFFNDTPTPEIYPLPLPDALPISAHVANHHRFRHGPRDMARTYRFGGDHNHLLGYLLHPLQAGWVLYPLFLRWLGQLRRHWPGALDRKSTRLNSRHLVISYAVFCF